MQAIEGLAGASLLHRRRVLKQPITYVGLDVHKDTIAVALAEAGKRGEVREHGKIANTPAASKALSIKLARSGGELRPRIPRPRPRLRWSAGAALAGKRMADRAPPGAKKRCLQVRYRKLLISGPC